jgi:hypothetical protein
MAYFTMAACKLARKIEKNIISGGFPKTSVFGKVTLKFAVLQG